MSSCQVKGCTNNRKFSKEGISFHLFPKKGPMVGKWLEVLGKKPDGWKWTKNMVVCSRHFTKDDFRRGASRIVIKPTAVPSVNLDLNTDARIAEYIKNEKLLFSDEEDDVASNSEVSEEEPDNNGTEDNKPKLVESMHSYALTPEELDKQNEQLKHELSYYKRALSQAKKQIKDLKDEVSSLKSAIGYVETAEPEAESQEICQQDAEAHKPENLKWWNVSSL
ncbi:unnamed protein product [Acanthoscelides obtectus]|uniref:THAP-type domain-containing protein n=1 Tax=Acanthoscelides obtectus TaxID=200917 RepID=A0A9P0PK93_ACAOB|nr:unnamed protein product [Acanthoscelides obtectus]CAK1652866.1 THAP domain-containing protein 1 [Acanthoscelides obtectus]